MAASGGQGLARAEEAHKVARGTSTDLARKTPSSSSREAQLEKRILEQQLEIQGVSE